MTREQLLAIAARHAEDHKFQIGSVSHPRARTWGADAVGDRAALLEFIAELMPPRPAMKLKGVSWLDSAREHLKTPALPPNLITRARKPRKKKP